MNIFHSCGFGGHALEKWRFLDVGRVGVPVEKLARGICEGAPMFVALEDGSIVFRKHCGSDCFTDDLAHLFLGGPEIAQVDRLAIDICAYRVLCQIDVDGAGEGIGDDQGWRGKETGPHLWMDTSLKITVAAQYGCYDEVVFLHGRSNWIGQWAAVAYTIMHR